MNGSAKDIELGSNIMVNKLKWRNTEKNLLPPYEYNVIAVTENGTVDIFYYSYSNCWKTGRGENIKEKIVKWAYLDE